VSDVSPPGGSPPTNRRGWWIHLALVTLYIVLISVLARYRSQSQGDSPALTKTAGGLLLVCTLELLLFGVMFGAAVVASRASRDDLLLRWRHGFWPVPLGIAYSVGVRLVVGVVTVVAGAELLVTRLMSVQAFRHFLINNRPDIGAAVDVAALRHNPVYFWLTLTVVSFVLGGVREELWRSAFLAGLTRLWPRRFGSKNGTLLAVTIAAVVFGAAHAYMGPLAVVFAAAIGFMLGLIMVLHRSIWPAVIAHGAFDATTVALLPWAMTRLSELQRTLGH
jgi:membrane protease YdiL (CAAX protease family)